MSHGQKKKFGVEVRKLDYADPKCSHKFWSMIYFDPQGNIFQDTMCPKCNTGWSTMLGYVVRMKEIQVKFTRQTDDQKNLEKWIKHNMQHVLCRFFSSMGKKRVGGWS